MDKVTEQLLLQVLSSAPAAALMFVVWIRVERRIDKLLDVLIDLVEKGDD